MDAIDKAAISVIACCHGYDEVEVERWADEADPEYDSDLASELAEVTSILRDAFAAHEASQRRAS